MIVHNEGGDCITLKLSRKEIIGLKLELLSIKLVEDYIPFIDKCPLSWQLLSELSSWNSNTFNNDTKLHEEQQANG